MRHIFLTVIALLLLSATCHAERSPTEKARDLLAQQMDIGESAPDWLMDAETYGLSIYGSGNATDWEGLAASKIAFVTHCPINSEYFDRCHKLGLRCLPYVTFYQGNADRTYQGVNLKDHPEFIEIDEKGNLRRSGFWESEDAKNAYMVCPNVKAYQDAMVVWIRKVMELGADGVFVDCLGTRSECFGPKFGKHTHEYEGTQDHAFAMLLKRVRAVIKQYKPDGVLIGNSANPLTLPHEYWKYLDADMLESYICTWVSKDRWFDWKDHWHKQALGLAPFVKAGKAIQALSYTGHTPYGVREDTFYCYASARLGGFVFNSGQPLGNPDIQPLNNIRLGRPLTDEMEENGVYYRVFERGLVALNPDKQKAGEITSKPPMPTTRLVDLFGGGLKDWNSQPEGNFSLDFTVKHNGPRSIRVANITPGQKLVNQPVVLNQTKATPIVASGWSKADKVSGGQPDGDYAVYLDICFADGTYLWGQIAPFTAGTHDWEYQSVVVTPRKPIRSLYYNLVFRSRTGTAWFADLSLKEGDDPEQGIERLKNGNLNETDGTSRTLDVAGTGGALTIPANSGRVYLFGASLDEQLAVRGPRLTIVTNPTIGNVRFRIDGFDYFTHSGRWTTEYVLGPEFGQFSTSFDTPGKHTIEIVDVVPAPMKTPAGYGGGDRLGDFMNPSKPTEPVGNKSFRFREWAGAVSSKSPQIEVEVDKNMTLTAGFDVKD